MQSITIRGIEYPIRDFELLSYKEACHADELNIRLIKALRKDRATAIAALFDYLKYVLPTITQKVLEELSGPECAAIDTQLRDKLIPAGMKLLDRYPSLLAYHDRRMNEEGLALIN